MIVYNLACDNAHQFEGWFNSAEDFARQHRAGQLSCPACGSAEIVKQPSAPYVSTGAREQPQPQAAAPATAEVIKMFRAKMLEYIQAHTEDVGRQFPDEARKIHYREAPERAIRGQATREEVGELRDEGIDVVQVPGPPVPPEQLH